MTEKGGQMPVQFERTRVNVFNVGSVFIGIAVTAFGWGATYSSMVAANDRLQAQIVDVRASIANEQQARKDRGAQTDANFKDIREQLPAIQSLQFQITRAVEQIAENRKSVEQSNARIDRVVESTSSKLDVLVESVNKLSTRLEVLANQIGETPKRTRLTVPQ